MKLIFCVAIWALPTLAMADQKILFDDQGRVAGRVLTDSSGKASVIYDRAGNVTGRTHTDSNGVTTIYGSDGSKLGTTNNSATKK